MEEPGRVQSTGLQRVRHRILGANALSFADVARQVGSILNGELADVEVERWQKLADLEARYLAALARRGKRDRIAVLKDALAKPVEFPGVEAAVVACVLDPIPVMNRVLDGSGLPVTELVPDVSSAPELIRSQIVVSGTAASEAASLPLSSPSPPASNPSQHQGLFQ